MLRPEIRDLSVSHNRDDVGVRRVALVSALVDPSVGGVEHYVRWARDAFPAAGIDLVTVACKGGANEPNPGCDVTVPTWWVRGQIPFALPSITTFARLWRAFAGVDAVLIQNLTHPLCLYAALVARLRGIPARTMIHEGDVPRFAALSLRLLKRIYDATAAKLTLRWAPPTTPSQSCARGLVTKFGHAVDAIPYPIQGLPTALDPPAESFTVVFAARYAPEKRPLDVIAAARRLPHIQFVMNGRGELAAECHEAAKDLSNVDVGPAKPWRDVVESYRTAHAVISASSHDTTQLALLEPMIMGIPAVATAVGEAPTYFDGPLNRFVCPVANVDALVTALSDLHDHYTTWRPIFAANAQHLRAEHDPAQVVKRTLAFAQRKQRATHAH